MSTRAERGMKNKFNQELSMQGGHVLPHHFTHRLASLKSRTLRRDDIILCSYPKSGTHWMWEVLGMLVRGAPEYATHWKNIGVLEYHDDTEMEAMTSPRVLSTHLPPDLLPEAELLSKRCRVVHCERNPKDAMVSFYSQHSNHNRDDPLGKPSFTGTWAEYFSTYMERCGPYGCILDHNKAWRKFHEDNPDQPYLHVQYEDMKQDDVKEIKRVAEFLGRPLSDDTYHQIAEACRFDKLKEASEKVKDQRYHNPWKKGSTGYFRKGIVGDWKNWFTVEQSEVFDEEHQRVLKEQFPY